MFIIQLFSKYLKKHPLDKPPVMRPQIVIKIIVVALFFLTSAVVLGQAESGSSGPPAPNMSRTPPELSLPIDSGVVFLIVAGLVYGVYIAYTKKRSKNSVA